MATVMTAEPHAFVDWTSSESGTKAIGKLLGRNVTVTGRSPNSVREVNVNREHTDFQWPAFTPSLDTSDSVELISRATENEFTIDLGGEVEEFVLHVGSLASILTFIDPGTTVTKVSGDVEFEVLPGRDGVKGALKGDARPTDSNGTVRVRKSRAFSSIKFKLQKNYIEPSPDDGVYLQFGRIVKFVDWTIRENQQTVAGNLDGQRVTVTGNLTEVLLNGEHQGFGTPSFTPSLSFSDSVGLVSLHTESEFTVNLGGEVQEVFLHLGSFGSIMTFDPEMIVTEVSGDEGFDVPQPNVVTGKAKNGPPTDSNGTIRVSKRRRFSSITFQLKMSSDQGEQDGVYLQIGR
ncbi:hypothetical protein AB0G20_37995 [Streptomyces sp. NPDC024017]|uniref:hypothetical protein n=1 Tax=Streptomyces sp. NPDC024017 TaxID=3154326 RepID=UPI0033CD7F35